MWLLSQGKWIKVLSPSEFVDEIKEELRLLIENYTSD